MAGDKGRDIDLLPTNSALGNSLLYSSQAILCLEKLSASMIVDGKLKHSTLIHKTPKIDAFLEDYAYLCDALIEAYQSTLDESYSCES